ncbi:MAG: ADP-ribosylglycohydrolase family protein, partial [Planctomycetes bacterium]|nr:ADP-ribosylglycohydrolase family protein [Planctomycetota bacterium]
FNISGQFVCECFGLVAPAMPQTAARIGLHYTHVSIDGEPAQTTQMFTAMIATAFVESDVAKIVEAGVAAVDPGSRVHGVARDVQRLWKEHPRDWRELRRRIHATYATAGGMRDANGYELNTACVLAALLYGGGNFVESLRLAFNLGYDADCNAATVGAVIGVVRGRKWMDAQGWNLRDVYRNTSRPGMPTDETLTAFGNRLTRVAGQVVVEAGGHAVTADGRVILRIPRQTPANVEPLARPADRLAELRQAAVPGLRKDLAGSAEDRARAAYLALCLGEADALRRDMPQEWARAVTALRDHAKLVKAMAAGGPDPAVAGRFKAYAAALDAPQDPPQAR